MSNILEMLSSHLNEEQVQAISQKLGASPAQTQSAIEAALPTLLGALGRKAADPDGAEQIHAAMSSQSSSMLDNLGGLIGMVTGGGGSATRSGLGSSVTDSILGQILGGKQSRVQDTIGKSSGLNAAQVGSLMSMLAPILLGAVSKHQKSQGLNPGDLSSMLQKETHAIEKTSGGSFIGRMLDQDGDGDFDISDMMKVGMSKFFGRK